MAEQRQTENDDGLEYVSFFNSNHKMLVGYECRTYYAIVLIRPAHTTAAKMVLDLRIRQ